jgi:hypothetical protein
MCLDTQGKGKHTLVSMCLPCNPPQAGGTRGDVQPAAALGVALAGKGARVRLAADAGFAAFVGSLGAPGLEFYPLGGNAREMMALTVKWGCVTDSRCCTDWSAKLRQGVGVSG